MRAAYANQTPIKHRANGAWHGILTATGIDAAFPRDRHGPCPGCGGVDRFRWDDKGGNGTFYCGGGGDPVSGTGFDLLMHTFNCDFAEAARMVEGVIGGYSSPRPLPAVSVPKPKPCTQALAQRVWKGVTRDDSYGRGSPLCRAEGHYMGCWSR